MANKPEILSPAGSWESLKAAAAAGADAVYFGASGFNARQNAENFSDSDIAAVVSYCHARGIKAYFTLNTLIFDNEIEKALELAQLVCRAGADAILVQDSGLADLINKAAPKMRLHASTQMSVHNLSGVRALARKGFSRVVLSRELSKNEIAAIAKDSPIELEVFVHGALCMSVSGQCYMSAFFGGCRSGNRGLCAQPCRLPFRAGGETHVLSLKDLSLLDYACELSNIGVSSLKIEGRMKRPEYVAAATAACKKAVEGKTISCDEKNDLQNVFSRDGFTDGFYAGSRDRSMFGVRTRENVVSADSVLKRMRALYANKELQRIKTDFALTIKKDKVSLTAADCDGNTVSVDGGRPEIALNHAIDGKTAAEKLSKTGSTPFLAGKIKTDIENGLTIKVALINSMRREALSKLLEKRSETKPVTFKMPLYELKTNKFSTGKYKNVEKYRLRFRKLSQIPQKLDFKKAEIVFLPIEEICNENIENLLNRGIRVGAELPRAVFSGFDKLQKQLDYIKAIGIKDTLCANTGITEFAGQNGFLVHGDFGLNITNSTALSSYVRDGVTSCILSFETPISCLRSIAQKRIAPCGVIVYGNLPLMLVRNCPSKCFNGCKKSGCSIKDRTGCDFPVMCRDKINGASEILNPYPLWLADRKDRILETGVDFVEFYFTLEDAHDVQKVIEAWDNAEACDGRFTRGLYFHTEA